MGRWFTVLGHCSLWLGTACIAPGWSHSNEAKRLQDPPSSVALAQQPTDRNWHAFWRSHLGKWEGTWTRYTAAGDIKETFASTRHFSANPAKTEIHQSNSYRYPDGRSIAKEWSYNITDHSHWDGFAHPASRPMRGLALSNGAAAWLIPSLQPNQVAPFELFLVRGDRRHSVGVVYGPTGELRRTASIREQRGQTSKRGWTDAILQVKPWHPAGHWQGQERRIRRDLSLAPVQNAAWKWSEADHSNRVIHYFPDGIILICPKRLPPAGDFSIQVIWMLDDDELQTITAAYNNDAELIGVTHRALSPTPSLN